MSSNSFRNGGGTSSYSSKSVNGNVTKVADRQFSSLNSNLKSPSASTSSSSSYSSKSKPSLRRNSTGSASAAKSDSGGKLVVR